MKLLVIIIVLTTSMFGFAAKSDKRKPNAVKATKAESETDAALKGVKFSCNYGQFKFTTKSQDPKALIEIYARKNLGVDVKSEDDFIWKGFTHSKDLPGADEDVSSFGITDEAGFSSLINGGENEADAIKLAQVINSLKKQKDFNKRYILAWGGGTGGSVCGVTWPGPILIDLFSKKIYDFSAICGDC